MRKKVEQIVTGLVYVPAKNVLLGKRSAKLKTQQVTMSQHSCPK